MVEMALLRALSVSTTPGVTIMSRYLKEGDRRGKGCVEGRGMYGMHAWG
jgi:hypothetical protein